MLCPYCQTPLTDDNAYCDGVVCHECGNELRGWVCDGECDTCSPHYIDERWISNREWIRMGGDAA